MRVQLLQPTEFQEQSHNVVRATVQGTRRAGRTLPNEQEEGDFIVIGYFVKGKKLLK